MKKLLLIFLLSLMALAQASAVTYYNVADELTILSNWNDDRGGLGSSPANFTSGDIFVVQQYGETVLAIWTVTGAGSKVSIESGQEFDSNGKNNNISLEILGIGKYYITGIHSAISFLTMSSSAIIELSGNSVPILRSDLVYPNLSIKSNRISGGSFSLNKNLTVTNNLEFDLKGDNSGRLTFIFVSGVGVENFSVNVGGDMIVKGSNSNIVTLNSSLTRTLTLTVTGDIIVANTGELQGTTSNGNATIFCNNFNQTGGAFRGTAGAAAATGIPTFTLTGDYNTTGGSYNARSGSATAIPVFNLNGSSKQVSNSTLANTFHTINVNGTYTLNNNFTVGGSLVLNNASSLNIAGDVLTLNGSLVANGTGTFTGTTGSLIFGGTPGVGASIPGMTLATLTINRAGQTIALAGNLTATTVDVTNGTLSIGANTLTVNGSISSSGTVLGGNSSNLDFTTSLAGKIVPSATYNNLTLRNTIASPIAVGAGGVTVLGTLDLLESAFNNSANSLTLGNGATIIRHDDGTAGSLSAVPTFGSTVNVTYKGTETITSGNELPSTATVLNNLTMDNSTTVTVSSARTVNGALTLTQGTLVSGLGNLTMNLNSGYIAKSGAGITSGDINCTRTIARGGYTCLSTPVQGSPSFPASSFFFYYDELNHDRTSTGDAGWKTISPSALGSIDANNISRGFLGNYGASTALTLTGTYDHTANYSIAVTKTLGPGDTNGQNGWNLIGNPFPSALDWNGVYTDNSSNMNAQIQYYTGTGYTASAAGVPGGLNDIPPMQSVLMKKTNLGSSTLNINKSRRVDGTKNLQRKGNDIQDVLEIAIDNGTLSDKTYIRLKQEASDYFDNAFDANKMNNSSSILPNINTVLNDFRYAINTISSDSIKGKMIPLKITVPASGNYDFRFREEARINDGITIYLHDKLLNVVQDVRLNPVYNIAAVKGDTSSRFFISFAGELTGVAEETIASVISANFDRGVVNSYFKNLNTITADISLYNSMGVEVFSRKNVNIASGKYSFDPNTSQTGVYVLKISTATKTHTQRLLINN